MTHDARPEAAPAEAGAVLSLTRRFAAPRAAVFRAWTEPAAVARWWNPREGFTVPRVEIDLRVGGSYRIHMESASGERFHLVGEYREVTPPRRLVYTWRWENADNPGGETLVTVDFRDVGDATEIALRHEGFLTPAARARHDEGWSGCLGRLAELLATPA